MASQFDMISPNTLKNRAARSTFWETIDIARWDRPDSHELLGRCAPQKIPSALRILSSWDSHKQISQSNAVHIRNVVELNPWDKIRDDVATWSELKADWDGDGAVAPGADGLKFLDRMIRRFKDEGSPKAKPYIAADGEFGLHWRLPGGKAVLSILADGRVLGFCPRRSGEPVRLKSTIVRGVDLIGFYKALREIAQ